MPRLTVLEYTNYRYLKLSCIAVALSVAAYAIHQPILGPRGDTWLGYTLGVLSALLVLVMLWYGVVRRRLPILLERRLPVASTPSSNGEFRERRLRGRGARWARRNASTLQGWFSAHIYFGTALVVLVTLHTGFRFSWNIHTFTYLLLIVVVLTGFYGLYAYIRFPRMMTENLGEDSMSILIADVADLNQLLLDNALLLPDRMGEIVRQSCRERSIGGTLPEQLRGRPWHCATRSAIDRLQGSGDHLDHTQAKINRDVYALLIRKESLLKRIRMELMYKARLQVWLYLHVPLAICLLAALVAHVIAVFFFW